MNYLQAIILGIVQGLTEFIPVSSSGHLVLVQQIFGFQISENLSFEIFLHLGTLFAVLIFFRQQIWELILSLFNWGKGKDAEKHQNNRKLILYLIIATFATGLIYLGLGDYFEAIEKVPLVVAIMLIITGIILYISDYVKASDIPAHKIGFFRSLLIGLAQGIAIIPGISRSGSTIGTSLFCKMDRKDAAHFSFLLSIPAILGANLVTIKEFSSLSTSVLPLYALGFLASLASGYLVISLLIGVIKKGKLKYFSYYLWLIGLISIAYFVFFR